MSKRTKLTIPAAVLLIMLTCLLFQDRTFAAVKAPKMTCHSYVVMDAGSGEVLFGQDEDKVIYPASTAKLMTAIVCIENGDVNSKIKTSSEVLGGTTYGTFCLGLAPGKKFTFRDLLSLSLVSSAADATDSLAVGVFGSKDACVEAMNAKCRELGLTQTHFDNPVGSDIGAGFNETYATAREMGLITRYAMAMPMIRETVRKSHYQTTSGQDIDANSTNWFIRGIVPYNRSRYTIIGSKSGTTNAAGHVFIATATDNDGHEVICAYFGNVSKESTFAGIRKLLNYTFKQYDRGKLELTGKCDDVRASDIRPLFDNYASLHIFPISGDGRYHPALPVNRTQLARMIKVIDATEGNPALGYTANCFASENKKGSVTAAKAASLIQDLYPSHLPDEEIKEILSQCSNTDYLDENEKEAFAIFVKSGLLPDDSCKNAKQLISRRQALVLADHLADYQVGFAARYPVNPSYVISADGSSPAAPPLLLNSKWKRHYDAVAAAAATQTP
ncbi:MAG: D-alanyl-D-alanine carboxypeptidase [Eubacterium sp.]|nr:D-alanyl-D-alanine carboxypeptidase [Eubacterium sp.]